MMVSYKYLSSPVKFDTQNVIVLVVENKELFRNTIVSLSNGNEDDVLIISKNFTPLDYSKQICLVDNPIIINCKNKRLQTKVNSELATAINELYFNEFDLVQNSISNLIYKLSELLDFNFFSVTEINSQSLVKFLSFEPKFESDANSLSNLLFYLELLKNHLNIECFVITNLFLYYSKEELDLLFNSLKLKNIYVVAIENHSPKYSDNNFKLAIVDDSLCSIVDDL